MKITKSQLKQLIKEEIEVVLAEANAQTQDEYINSLSVEQEKLYDEYRELLKYDPQTDEEDKAWNDKYHRLMDAGLSEILQALKSIRDEKRKNRKPSNHGRNWGFPGGTGDRGTGYAIPGVSE
jgi:glutamyl-tRNA reductase